MRKTVSPTAKTKRNVLLFLDKKMKRLREEKQKKNEDSEC